MTRHDPVDVLVIGAGPAGAATALLLARAGHHVLLLDRHGFPRAKPCGDCLSPEAARVLDRLGLLAAVEAERPARLEGWRIVAPAGASFTARFGATADGDPRVRTAIALSRDRLDHVLVDGARRAGAELHTGFRVTDVIRDGAGRVAGVHARGPDGRPTDLHARLVIGADGLRSVIARRLHLLRRGPRLRKLSLTAHLHGVQNLDHYGEMHLGDGICAGLAPVEEYFPTTPARASQCPGLEGLSPVQKRRRRGSPEGREDCMSEGKGENGVERVLGPFGSESLRGPQRPPGDPAAGALPTTREDAAGALPVEIPPPSPQRCTAAPRCNLTLVVDAPRFAPQAAKHKQEFFWRTLRRFPRLAGRLDQATFADAGPDAAASSGPLLASGPFDCPTRDIVTHGAALVGDAAGYYDPFTGQGIFRALAGAELLAAVADAALRKGEISAQRLRPYARRHASRFRGARALQHLIEAVAARPRLADAAIRRLGGAPGAAEALIAVTGDLQPAYSLLSPALLLTLLLGTSTSESHP